MIYWIIGGVAFICGFAFSSACCRHGREKPRVISGLRDSCFVGTHQEYEQMLRNKKEIEKMIEDKINSNNINLAMYAHDRGYKDCACMPPHPERGYEVMCCFIERLIDGKIRGKVAVPSNLAISEEGDLVFESDKSNLKCAVSAASFTVMGIVEMILKQFDIKITPETPGSVELKVKK